MPYKVEKQLNDMKKQLIELKGNEGELIQPSGVQHTDFQIARFLTELQAQNHQQAQKCAKVA